MKLNPFFLLLSLFCCAGNLFGQTQAQTVQMEHPGMRARLDVHAGDNEIQLCALVPGNSYTVIALGAVLGQKSSFTLRPGNVQNGKLLQEDQTGALDFTATEVCHTLHINVKDDAGSNSVPMYLSVKCGNCPDNNNWIQQFAQKVSAAKLNVVSGVSATSLIQNTLVGGTCFNVANITSAGNTNSRGTFSSGATNIGIGTGMILATGTVSSLPGPNNVDNANGGFNDNSVDDPDLKNLVIGNQFDLSKIEFDFTPTANTVQFDFVFGSEEYCEFVNSQFNDVFGFFISGPGITGNKNIGTLPSTNVAISTNNVNHISNTNFYVNNTETSNGCLDLTAFSPLECQLDGWTKVITATANVIPCSTYHIKLAIADIADQQYASAVFLRANSFDAGGTAKAEPVYPPGLQKAYEGGCGPASFRFSRDSVNLNQPLTVNFAVTGTATPNVDYTALTSPVVIPAGQTSILVPVNVLTDALAEGNENIQLLIDNACTCTQAIANMTIADKPGFGIGLSDQTVCSGVEINISPLITEGVQPFTYLWSTGATTAQLHVTNPGAYTVQVKDLCGRIQRDTAIVIFGPAVELTKNVKFCPGASVTIAGNTYSQSGTVLDTIPGSNNTCDTVITYLLQLLPQVSIQDSISFCPGSFVRIDGTKYFTSGTVLDTLPGKNGACDTLATYYLTLLPYNTKAQTITFCPRTLVNIGGQIYSQPGTVLDTIPGLGGSCDTIVTYTLVQLSQPTRAETRSFCPGESVNIGGQLYSQPGTVLDTIPGKNGVCDTIVTYTLIKLSQPTRAETRSFCPGAGVNIGGQFYNQPGTVLDTVPGKNGACDTIITYTLIKRPQPTRAETIKFCPGETVKIGGQSYSQPGTVINTHPGIGDACDTIVTYTLIYRVPAPSVVQITCPNAISVDVPGGATSAVVNYANATATSNCVCPGVTVTRSSGLASGSNFPLGTNNVCFKAEDACGQTATCCLQITVNEESACDIKVIGCVKFELLTIRIDAKQRLSYRIRTTNNCTNKLLYMAIEIPSGYNAVRPTNNSTYVAPSGHTYAVRNPNFSPFYSVRFSSLSDSLRNGGSDVFKYTLQAQADPDYIQVLVRLQEQIYSEAYLNTFYCPVLPEVSSRDDQDETLEYKLDPSFILFPNPSDGQLFADFSAWEGQLLQLKVFNAQGQLIQASKTIAAGVHTLELPASLSNGVYWLDVHTENGEHVVKRFLMQR